MSILYPHDELAQTKTQIMALLSQADTEPRHRFGQNFMIDQNLVRTVVAAGQIVTGDVLIEVGPGTGTLTEELLASDAARVIAVEIDRDLAKLIRERFKGNDRFKLIEGDALSGKHQLNADLIASLAFSNSPEQPALQLQDHRVGSPSSLNQGTFNTKLIANLPYNIASPLVIELLIAGVDLLGFTVQKEVADRLRANAGEDAYGPLSVMVQMLARVEVLRMLPPQAFWPAPRIDSALVRLVRHDKLGPSAGAFTRFIHQVFSFRRKTLRKALSMSGIDAESLLEFTSLDGQQRPEEFTPDQFWQMFSVLPKPDRIGR